MKSIIKLIQKISDINQILTPKQIVTEPKERSSSLFYYNRRPGSASNKFILIISFKYLILKEKSKSLLQIRLRTLH